MKVNRKKTCAMVVERQATGQRQIDETLVYMEQEVTFLAPEYELGEGDTRAKTTDA